MNLLIAQIADGVFYRQRQWLTLEGTMVKKYLADSRRYIGL